MVLNCEVAIVEHSNLCYLPEEKENIINYESIHFVMQLFPPSKSFLEMLLRNIPQSQTACVFLHCLPTAGLLFWLSVLCRKV